METNRYQRVKEVFGAVVDAPADARGALLHEQCGDDTALYREVQALLQHVDAPRVNIEKAAAAAQATISSLAAKSRRASMHAALAKPGDMFGGYRILGVLGEGGMGIVYLAEQDRPRRTVALKVVKPGYLSASMLRRFEHETQVLGRLQHPGIAQIFEAGTADAGAGAQPYFAMEYVKGRPLLEYANSHGMGTRQRLELLIRICDAAHHAHLQGVIHRDLKPANILVASDETSTRPIAQTSKSGDQSQAGDVLTIGRLDASFQPKILDFGIARSTDADIHTTTLRTDIGQLIGTIPYMSPEQVAGDPGKLDARSDIYALGVIGYEMLAGRLPHDLRGKTIPEAVRIIGEHEPTPLSSINRFFRGDLDTIISKALEREPERRYATAADLAADIRRYLDDHPIVARPPTVLYQLTKFAKRNRAAVTALGAVFLMLIVSIIAVSIYAVQATIARDDAQLLQKSESAAHELAIANARRLAEQLTVSNIERGRLQGLAGNIGQAEELLWAEYLHDPTALSTHWALWELYSLEPCLQTLQAHTKGLWNAAFTADSNTIITSGDDGMLRIWTANPITLKREIKAHDKIIFRAAAADDLDTIISVSEDGVIRTWSAASGRMLQEFRHPEKVLSRTLVIAPDQVTVLSGGSDGVIRAWDFRTGTARQEYRGQKGYITGLAFSDDGTRLVSTSNDGTLAIWNAQEPASPPRIIKAHINGVTHVALTRDGRVAATGGADHHVELWDVDRAERITTLDSPNGVIQFVRFSPDDRTLYTGGWWRIERWDVATHARLNPISTHASAYVGAPSPDGRLLVAGFDDGLLRAWEVRGDRGVLRFTGMSERVTGVFNRDGTMLATGDNDGMVRLWDAKTGSLIRELKAHTGRVRPVIFHPTQPLLFTGALDRFLRVWNIETGEMVKEIKNHNAGSNGSIDLSPDGTLLAYARTDVSASIVTWPECREVHTFKTPGREALSIQFNADASQVAFTARGDYIGLFDVKTGASIATLPTSSMVWNTDFSPDGQTLYGGIWTREVFKWDLRSPQSPPIEFTGHNGLVSDVQTRPGDPRVLASAGTDGALKLWDTRTGNCLATIKPFGGWEVITACFAPDGKRLLATGSNGEAAIYDLEYYDTFIQGNLAYQQQRAEKRTR